MIQGDTSYIEKGVGSKKNSYFLPSEGLQEAIISYSRSLQNKHVATSIMLCKADDYSLEFLNGAGRH